MWSGRSIGVFFAWWDCIRRRMLSRARTASTMRGPLFSITHSARSPIAASVTSARDGRPPLASPSRTCVAQIAGRWAASQSQPLESDLDREVAPGDHHPGGGMPERREQDRGEGVEAASCLELEDHAHAGAAQAGEGHPQPLEIPGGVDEGEPDEVRVTDDEPQALQVLRHQRGKTQVRIGKVDPPVRGEPCPADGSVGDLDPETSGLRRPHDPPDSPVIEPDRLAGPDHPEALGEGAGDLGRSEHPAPRVPFGLLPYARAGRHDQRVADTESDPLLDRR
jgi:hypothetical protein